MKKCLTLCLCLTSLLCLILITTPKASAATYGDLIYTVYNGKVTITDCNTSATGALTIPATIDGCPVTTIGYRAFYNCYRLTAVTIPDSVTTIGSYAFYNCTSLTSVTIPDSVTTIGDSAFEYCTSLTSITIPDSVTTIGEWAFYYCTSLTSITIPDSVTTIGDYAFYYCTSLTSVTIPDSVTTIGEGAFSYCTGLTSITIPDSVTSIGNSAFYNCTSLTDVYITDPNAWCKISFDGDYANPLYYANNGHILDADGKELTELVLDTSVTSIPDRAFRNCKSLTSITIPDSVTTIGSSAFSGCSNLESMTIPFVGDSRKTATDTYQYPFGYIFGTSSYVGGVSTEQYYGSSTSSTTSSTYYIPEKLKSVTVTGGNILYGAFRNCTNLTGITIGDSVTSIGNSAFEDCTSLTSVTIPDSVTTIGNYAFNNCTSLTSITIPDSVTTIGVHAFYYCNSLTDVYITDLNAWCKISFGSSSANPLSYADNGHILDVDGKELTELVLDTSVTSIPAYAFRNCKSLASITIPDSVTTIGDRAFYYCTSLTSVTIPDSVTTIGAWAFEDCSSLTGVYITDITAWCNISFDNYSANPLYYAKNLYLNGELVTDLVIPSDMTSIGEYAFYKCTSLQNVTIPDSVTTIGYDAFSSCTSLTSVTIGDNVTTIGDRAFYYCTSLTSVTIPDSVTTIGAWAFEDCSSLTGITIPDSVTTIGSYAFYKCTSLTSVTIPDSLTTIGNYAFSSCTGLTSVTIPDSVTSIGDSAFSSCDSLFSVTIPDSVTTIGYAAFRNCTGLTSITIGDSVTTIGNYAFYNCSKLKNVYYSGTEAQWKNISIGSYNSPLNNATKHYSHIHDYTLFPAETVAPTCTADGYTIYTCVYGETMKSHIVPALGHVPGSVANKLDATCTQQGYTEYICSRCQVQFQAAYVDALGHDYSGPVVEAYHNCTEKGYSGASCTRCDAVRQDTVLPALGHNAILIAVCDPTCTEKGVSKAGTQCQRCKTYLLEPVWIPALGHSFTDYIPNNDATYFADGTKTATCTTCGEKDTVVDEGTRLIPEGNVILLHPENVTANSGATVSFSIEAFGQIVSYQWQYRKLYKWFDTTMTGYNTDTLTVAATGARNGYDYRCVVTFADGTVLISEPAELTVNTQINITYHPNDQTVVLGYYGQFTAAAEGEGLKYQWYYKRPNDDRWAETAMSGSNKPTVMIKTTTARDGYQYKCKITDVTGNEVFTEPATMRVLSFTSNPKETFAATGSTVTFSVTASVDSGFTYQWQYSKDGVKWTNTTMTGCYTDTLTVEATKARNGYMYRCQLTGSKNSKIESKGAVLHVGDPVAISAQPQSVTAAVGEVTTFTVEATNAYSYQWQYARKGSNSFSKTSLTGATTNTLTVDALATRNGYQYRCEIKGLDGKIYYTDIATLIVQ